MTESEWLACDDPRQMLAAVRDRASDRKLRLFACGCCRQVWQLLTDDRDRKAVSLAEAYADGLADRGSLMRAVKTMPMPEWPGGGPEIVNWRLVTTGIAADMTDPRTYVWLTAETGMPELTPELAAGRWATDGAHLVPAPTQAGILRDLFCAASNPMQAAPSWRTPTVGVLARAAYEQRELPAGTLDGARLAVLGDALEEAGCTAADVLTHLRGPGPHVRGCWALDLVLGQA